MCLGIPFPLSNLYVQSYNFIRPLQVCWIVSFIQVSRGSSLLVLTILFDCTRDILFPPLTDCPDDMDSRRSPLNVDAVVKESTSANQFSEVNSTALTDNFTVLTQFRQEKKRPFTRTSRLHELNAVRFSARGYCKFYGPNVTTFPGLETFGMLALILSREQRIETLQVLLPNKASNSLANEKKDL